MEIRTLQYFLTVAREENISGAADFLHITQPTLSRQMMELEKDVGKKLFIRGNRKITLTEEGMLLRKRAEEIIDLVHKTEAELLSTEETVSGDIYIGAGETDVMRMLAKEANKLQKEHQNIRFHIYSGNGDDVTERLDKGLIDFGVMIEPININKYHSIRLPAKDVWGVLMPQDSPLAAKEHITPRDLWALPLISSRQTLVRSVISDWIEKDFEELDLVATYNLIFNASLLVEEGLGYALCLDKLVNTSGNSNLCFRPLEPKLEAGLTLVWKKHQIFSKASELFLNRMKESINQ